MKLTFLAFLAANSALRPAQFILDAILSRGWNSESTQSVLRHWCTQTVLDWHRKAALSVGNCCFWGKGGLRTAVVSFGFISLSVLSSWKQVLCVNVLRFVRAQFFTHSVAVPLQINIFCFMQLSQIKDGSKHVPRLLHLCKTGLESSS